MMKDKESMQYYYSMQQLEEDLLDISMKYSDKFPNHVIKNIKELKEFITHELDNIEHSIRRG